jgi:hypothetical protein
MAPASSAPVNAGAKAPMNKVAASSTTPSVRSD